MKGIISALALSSNGILAAGTFTRWIGLYDGRGRGGTISLFGLRDRDQDRDRDRGVGGDVEERTGSGSGSGSGITQLLWSECGRYLVVVERGSDGMGVWDVRGSGRRLAWLRGRKAITNQRMGAEIVAGGASASGSGDQVWAGGTDGRIRVWTGVGQVEGVVEAECEMWGHDGEFCFVVSLVGFGGRREEREGG